MKKKYLPLTCLLFLVFTFTSCTIDIIPKVGVPSGTNNHAAYNQVLQAVKQEKFSSNKLSTAKYWMQKKNTLFSLSQIRTIAHEFSFSKDRLNFLQFAYNYAYPKKDYDQLSDLLKFSSDRERFRNFVASRNGR